jgi:CRP/FNR family transcriptional regulator, cyclic AMP receptor protein
MRRLYWKGVEAAQETVVATLPCEGSALKTAVVLFDLEVFLTQIVFSQSDPACSVFYTQAGKLKVVVTSEQGKEAEVGFLGSRQFFGEGCLSGHLFCTATTTAMEDRVITSISKEIMIA